MRSSAERRRAGLGLVVAGCLALTACSGGDDSPGAAGSPSTTASSAPPSDSASPSSSPTSAPASITPAEVGALVKGLRGTADVKIQIGTQCTLEGTAVLGPKGSLRGHLDFRSADDADYVAADGRVQVTVPSFASPGPTTPHNPWGQAFGRIDPGIVPLVIADHATAAEAQPQSDGGIVYVVTLDGPATLTDFGSDPSEDLPDSVKYVVEVDGDGQVISITADFDDFGFDVVDFTAWRS